MRAITRNELLGKIQRADDFALVEVLPSAEYDRYHLPGALNVPLGKDFSEKIQQALPNKQQAIVVYCKDSECEASPEAAKRLDDLGYREVMDYSGGKVDWKKAGLRVEEGRHPD